MRQMSDTLARASAFRFTTAESLEPVAGTGGRQLRFSRSVTVRRPDAIAFEVHGSGDTTADVSARYDGSTVSLRENRHGIWAQTAVPRHSTPCWMTSRGATRFPCPSPTWSTAIPTRPSSARPRKAGSSDARRSTASNARTWRTPTPTWTCRSGSPRRASRCRGGWSSATSRSRERRRLASTSRAGISRLRSPTGTFTFRPGEATEQVALEDFVAALLSGGDLAGLPTPGPSAPGAPQPQ